MEWRCQILGVGFLLFAILLICGVNIDIKGVGYLHNSINRFDEVSTTLVSSAKIPPVIDFASPESVLDKTKRGSATFKECLLKNKQLWKFFPYQLSL